MRSDSSSPVSFTRRAPRARNSALLLAVGTLLAGMAAPAAFAQAQDGAAQWGLGLGVGVQRQPYRGVDNDTKALPLVLFENRWVSVAGPGVDLKLPSYGPLSFRLRARYSDDGYEASDSPFLTGMAERKDGFWLGAAAIWRTDFADVSAELLGDASSHSKGQKFTLAVERRFQLGEFSITPRLAAQSLDKKYVSYYYGVDASEATAQRAQYDGKSTVNLEAGVRVGYAIAPKQSVFLDVSGTRLGSGIKDSPLVERSSLAGIRVGYLYRF